MRILLVEDNELLGEAIRDYLKKSYFTVDWVKDGLAAQRAILPETDTFDLIILDIGLPGKSGIAVLNSIREKNILTPVIILTAKDDIDTKILSLDTGANDFMSKPLNFEELKARINSHIRTAGGRKSNILQVGDVSINPKSFQISAKEEEISLSKREFMIVQKIAEKAGSVVTREQIAQTIYGWQDDSESNTIEVYLHSIRKKLGEHLNIRTIRGVGYIIDKKE